MIIEGLLTTEDARGQPHIAAMGPVVDRELNQWLLRPFQTSTTFSNLRAKPNCVFHVTDDVLTIVRVVLKQQPNLKFEKHDGVWLLPSACHWHRLAVSDWNVDQPRSEATARRVASGQLRAFWGWNRAKHLILEATILMTRLHLLDRETVESQLELHRTAVEKTAGEDEFQAWELVERYFADSGAAT
ncbi:MAG: DUF447 domain-containing protein [Pirellulaceae bacterium]